MQKRTSYNRSLLVVATHRKLLASIQNASLVRTAGDY